MNRSASALRIPILVSATLLSAWLCRAQLGPDLGPATLTFDHATVTVPYKGKGTAPTPVSSGNNGFYFSSVGDYPKPMLIEVDLTSSSFTDSYYYMNQTNQLVTLPAAYFKFSASNISQLAADNAGFGVVSALVSPNNLTFLNGGDYTSPSTFSSYPLQIEVANGVQYVVITVYINDTVNGLQIAVTGYWKLVTYTCGGAAARQAGPTAAAGATCTANSISIASALPNNADPLFYLADDLPPFCAWGSYTAGTTNPVQVQLQLVDKNQNPIAQFKSPPMFPAGSNLSWGSVNCKNPKQLVFLPEGPIPQIQVPAGATYKQVLATYYLEASLIDAVTMNTLATSLTSSNTVVAYNMELGVDLKAQLQVGVFDLTGPGLLSGVTNLNPAQNVFVAYHPNTSLSYAISPDNGGLNRPILVLDNTLDFAGTMANLATVVTQADSTGEILSTSVTNPESISQGQNIDAKTLIQADLAAGAATVSFTPRLTLANTQTILFQPPITFSAENVTLTQATPSPSGCLNRFSLKAVLQNCLIKGNTTDFTISGNVLAAAPGGQLFQALYFDDALSGQPTPVKGVQITPGKSVPFSDTPSVTVPQTVKKLAIFYVLTRGGATPTDCITAKVRCAAAALVYETILTKAALQLLASNVNTTQTIADGTLKLLAIQASAQVQSAVTNMNVANSALENIGSVGLASSFGLAHEASPLSPRPLPARALSTAASPAGNQILSSLSNSWVFSPAVPRDGVFSASLALNYSSVPLPDDPNFSESKLQMISIDPAGTLHVYQTTIDLMNHIATATVDELDPYVSLAVVGQSGQTPIMLPSAGSGYVLVNGGSQNANITQTPFDSGGTGTAATAPLKPGSQTGVSPAWVQAWSDSPAAAGASWFDNGQLYAITPSSAPDGGFILPDVAYDAHTSTELDLANTTTVDADITIVLFGADGSTKGTYQSVLAAKSSMSARLESLFPAIANGFTGYVTIVTDGLLAVSGYRWTGSTVASLQAQSFATVKAMSLFAPQLGGTGVTSTVHLVNAGTGTATVTLTAYSGSTPQTFPLKLPAGQQYTNTIDAIFNIDPATAGSLKVTSDTGGIFGDILVSDSSFIPSFAYSVPLTSQTYTSLAFPIASAATHLYVFNPNSAAANVTVTPYAANGTMATATTISVAANGRADIPMASGSFLILSSDQAVVAFGTSAGSSGVIAAYPGIAVSGLSVKSGGPGPAVPSGGIVNAASFSTKLARGGLATVFGSSLSTSTGQAQSLPLSASLGGANVTVGGIPAPLVYASPTQINFQVPFEVPTGTANVVVTAGGTPSAAIPVTVADYGVGVFSCGAAPCAVHYATGQLVTSANPATPSEVLIVYGTGVGKLTTNVATGQGSPSSPVAAALDNASITIGGAAAQVLFAGLTPGYVGLVQFNIQLPANLPSGNLPLVVQFPGDSSAPVNLYVAGNAGTAAPKIGVAPSSLTFGNVTVGQNSSLPLAISNSGNAALIVNSITSSNSMFSATSPAMPFTVQPGGSTGVTIRFSPTAATSQFGNLTIASTDPASPQFTVGISGAGIAAAAPSITVSPSSLAFGSVTIGKPLSMTLTINNVGTATLNVSSISANNPMFTPSATSASVAAGASFNVSVQFAPTAAVAQPPATLTLASNDPAHPTVTVALTGTGVSTAPSTVTLSVDGGTFNNTVGLPGAANALFVNRLTPPSYPATLTAIQIYFGNRSNGLQAGAPFTLVAGTNPSGSSSFSSATLGIANDYSSTVSAVGTFSTYTLPSPITITSGDFVVGFAAVNPAGLYPADEDQATKSQGRSYVSTDGATFTVIDSYGATLAGNFGVRAVVTIN